MNRRQQELEQRVNALLADPANADSPLGQALQEVWSHLHDHLRRLERLTALSDSAILAAMRPPANTCQRPRTPTVTPSAR